MQEKPIYNCKNHGLLTLDKCYVIKPKTDRTEVQYRCKKCAIDASSKTAKRSVLNLSDSYIKSVLLAGSKGKLKRKDIPQELIELKRTTMVIKKSAKQKERDELEKWMQEHFIAQGMKTIDI